MFIGEPDALILARLIASAQGRHLPLRRAPLGSSTLSSVVPSFPAAVGGSSVGPLLPLLLGRHRGLCRHRCLPAPPYSLITLLLTTELLCHATAMGRRLWGRGWELECGARMMPALPRSKPAALAEWEEAGVDGTPAAAGLPLLDMPELVLDRVQEELSPASLTVMACLCTALKDWCFADVLLERHLRAKWGPLLGATAWEEWEGEEEEVTGHDPTLRLPVRRSQWTARAEHREAGSRDDR
ncbi:hypothetical protein C2845_PM11G07680 [Panicum miliaceum]|uniref:F-box domain-containing protein n=1 Tax=Panicum miliaceum TaxID=4540 RepID=A0A3L6RRC4_PANMI|nr:hypothetical protein C2845_PM11G07680 [Panicum miliaceum]